MTLKKFYLPLLSIAMASIAWKPLPEDWIAEKYQTFDLLYKTADVANKDEYASLIDNGLKTTTVFFGKDFNKHFDVYVHPDRQSLDKQWQKDWKVPDFKSDCWMVASGVGNKLDMISPKTWDKTSCEHSYADKLKTQQLITHELVHVYHGQLNVSKDFSDTEGIDWFVEGLAVYASGQYDAGRMAGAKKLVVSNSAPVSLDDFWKGNLKYGLSGSVVAFIDHKFGRQKLIGLLKFNKKAQVLSSLDISEKALLAEWSETMRK